jgi:alpha-tubulin suppressor-like RCC1 family protein
LSLFLLSFLLVGCGSSGGGGSSGNGTNNNTNGGGNNTTAESSDRELTGFTFSNGVIKNATISGNDVDITIDYDYSYLTPTVTHTGVRYSPYYGAVDFENLPATYTITAENGLNNDYQVVVRRAFKVSNPTELEKAISTINSTISNNKSISYITILVANNIILTNNITIPSTWAGKNIILEKDNSALLSVTVTGLTVANSTVGLVGVKAVSGTGGNNTTPKTDKELTGFTFSDGVVKNATLNGTVVDITIDYASTHTTPIVTHTGVSYSPDNKAIDFSDLPATYTITAEDNSTNDYQVVVRRSFEVSNETGLVSAINTINADIANNTYITILVANDINLTSNKTIPSAWVGKSIILEKYNSNPQNVTIRGLTLEENNTVELIGVTTVANNGTNGGGNNTTTISPKTDKELTGFTFYDGVVKNATINGTSVDITVDYYTNHKTPEVNHTGIDHSPKGPIDFEHLPANYKITAENNSTNAYQVVVRRAFKVSNPAQLEAAIGVIDNAIVNNNSISYITILVTEDINLGNNKFIASGWQGRNIILEKYNSSSQNVTIRGLVVGDGLVGLVGVTTVANNGNNGGGNNNTTTISPKTDKNLTGFTFASGIVKLATINGTTVDITIDYASQDLTPRVTHTGVRYSPDNAAINFANLPQLYTITAEDNSIKNYSAIIRRAFIVSNENALSSAINTIDNAIANNESINYITILVTNDITLRSNKTISSGWQGRNIILENNSSASYVIIKGLTVEDDAVELIGVYDVGVGSNSNRTSGGGDDNSGDDDGSGGSGTGNNTQHGDSKDLTDFTFPYGVLKNAIISGTDVDITIDYAFYYLTPIVTYTGAHYSPYGAIDFAKLPANYTVTADDSSTQDYNVTVRRAFVVSSEYELATAIDTISYDIAHNKSINYITILVANDISLTNNITIPSTWAGNNIILEKYNSATQDVSIAGLTVEGTGTVELVGVQITNFVSISVGVTHSIAVDRDGKLWVVGRNNNGELGLGNNIIQDSFKQVTIAGLPTNAKFVSVAAGDFSSFALDSDGKIWVTGANDGGQLGLGNNINQNSFQPVIISGLASGAKIVSVAAGLHHSFALDSNGGLWATGQNKYGELGLGDNLNKNLFRPVIIAGLASNAKIVSVSSGHYHSLALDSDGRAWGTGLNNYCQLGLGHSDNQNLFTPITISNSTVGTKIVSVATGYYHSLAVTSDGKLWGTGWDSDGQLGLGNSDTQCSFQPITISGLAPAKIVSISSGYLSSIALDSNGRLWGSGRNHEGELGFGNYNKQISFQPITISGLSSSAKIVSVTLGWHHSFVVDSDNKVWGAGNNGFGQLGLGDFNSHNLFTPASLF